MLDIVDDKLVVNSKGIYSIENYLTTRRLMYWQVYLHKTTVAFEKMLVNTLRRAKMLARQGKELFASPALRYFLYNEVDASFFEQHHDEALHNYSMLDDSDIWSALKVWMTSEDKILALLSSNLINRHIFRVEIHEEPVPQERIDEVLEMMTNNFDISREDASYLMSVNTIQKDMYDVNDDRIAILYRDGSIRDISDASEILNVALLSKKIRKYYLCYQRIS
jgi:HD superfamily phosphohydrolase